jgi:DNA-binding FadR family transcriptional regulator
MPLPSPGASRSLAAVFTPIKSGGLVDEVCRRIELAIETGLLTSGQRLPNEVELAAALGVAPVTAREALSQLRGRGLIRTTRGRHGGSFIAEDVLPSRAKALDGLREMTRLQLGDLGLHYRAIVTACAGVAARRADAADVAALRTFIRPEQGSAAGPPAWQLAASEFVLEVAAIARSARLARELLRLHADLGTLALLPFTDAGFREQSASLREEVAARIEAHDAAGAEAAARALVDATTGWLLAEHERIQETGARGAEGRNP